ncbi:MAG: CmpA/NrtA family ABC transporter substrate-binding protein, partial [Massilia sp.]
LGIGCQQKDMAVLMNLSQNGQAITLSRAIAAAKAADGTALVKAPRSASRPYTFAHTFPTGNHAMLLYYWLAAHNIHPLRDVRTVTVPPAQMVASLREGMIDGFCVGEPWGQRALQEDIGITAATSQQIWPDHPGKVLGTSASFAQQNADACRALIAAVLEAGRWIDASEANKLETAAVLAGPAYLNSTAALIAPRLLGQYENGLGEGWTDPNALAFHRNGAVNFPYLSDGMWFMTQHRRWGLVKEDPDYLAIASRVNQVELYRAAAQMTGTVLPEALMRSSTLIDGTVWDGSDPAAYAGAFAISHDHP